MMSIVWSKSVKVLPESPGIYGMRCEAIGRVYVGSSINLRARCRDHISRLRGGSHRNRFLQAAWSEFGEVSFVWSLIESLPDGSGLTEKELLYIEQLNTAYSSGGFNLELSPRKGGYDITTRLLLSRNMLGPSHPHRGKKFPKEYCERISARVRAAGPMAGRFKGVNLDARTKTFMARIYVDGKQRFLGRYETDIEAAHAYNIAAIENFGSGCFVNAIDIRPILNRRTALGRPAMDGGQRYGA